ncbi:MAG: EamA/RhaT family transporter, partial [Rhodocyclaceae bacterium]
NGAEWVGLGAGICFALQNVLIRRMAEHPVEHKTVTVFAGVVAAGLAVFLLRDDTLPTALDGVALTTLLLIGLVLMVANLVVQVGLSALAANRAIVILLFELVVAALSSWLLAGEIMGLREWLGGGLIVAASLLSGRLEGRGKGVNPAP